MHTIPEIRRYIFEAHKQNILNYYFVMELNKEIHEGNDMCNTRRTKKTAMRNALKECGCHESIWKDTYCQEDYIESTAKSKESMEKKLNNIQTVDYNDMEQFINNNLYCRIRSRLLVIVQLATGCRSIEAINVDWLKVEGNNVCCWSRKQQNWTTRPIVFITPFRLQVILDYLKNQDLSKFTAVNINLTLKRDGFDITSHDLRRIYCEVAIAHYKPDNCDKDSFRMKLLNHKSYDTNKRYAYINVINIPALE